MQLYSLFEDYASEMRIPSFDDSETPKLGRSLSLFHSCLLQAGLTSEKLGGIPRVTAAPKAITPSHLSLFIIGFLPNHPKSSSTEINTILFDLFSFLKWLDKKGIPHGLTRIDYQKTVKEIFSHKDRCHQISQLIENMTRETLEEPPTIYETLQDVFTVTKTGRAFIHIAGTKSKGLLRLRMPKNLLKLIQVNDRLDLILGNTFEQWVVIEGADIYPGYPS